MQLIERTLGLMGAVSAPPQGRTLTELATQLSLPMPTAHRLLKDLLETRWVRKNDRGEFFPGQRLLQLASDVASQAELVDLVESHLADLGTEFDETAFVATMVNDNAVCVAASPSSRALHVAVPVGRSLPLHASAGARALLAFRPPAQVLDLLADHAFRRYTDDTPGSVEEVVSHLAEVRERGYDICENELDVNVWAVSAPVTAGDGVVAASLTVAAPRERLRSASARRSVIASVLRHAAEIGATLPVSAPRVPAPALTPTAG
ncbi:IclR family transcriptional regulator [Litorihabitans aurantiacus]|uniref:IclR family transcriptional regulator n=1 Tax=Litorihabitans aurantiacus TaxID=1930061 RepID=A0AA37UWM3_9MICO|nr:IclR family transcriptional regulator [Litorihabitans aurantiacus]GMA30502.1 IclR family transcriptional regulator [Litorihabitans aurantiacus]